MADYQGKDAAIIAQRLRALSGGGATEQEALAALTRLSAAQAALEQAEAQDRWGEWKNEAERYREALEAEHEDRCGCPRPGEIAYCVAGANFAALTTPESPPVEAEEEG